MYESGFYWVVLKGKLTIGEYRPHTDIGTERPFPWSVVGERIGFETHEFDGIHNDRIKEPRV